MFKPPSILAIPALTAAALASAASAQLLTADHFDASIPPAWTPIKGNQWWADGWLHNQHTDPPFVNGRDSGIGTHVGDMTWLNYTLSLRVEPIRTQAFSGEYWKRAGVLFRASNFEWAYFGYGPHATCYNLEIVAPGDNDPPRVVFGRAVDNVWTELARVDDWSGGPAAEGPYDVYITAEGTHLTVSIGGEKLFDLVDNGGPMYGGVVLHSVWESHARFDDVTVGALPADVCSVDFNGDGFVDFFDYDAFVAAFETGC